MNWGDGALFVGGVCIWMLIMVAAALVIAVVSWARGNEWDVE